MLGCYSSHGAARVCAYARATRRAAAARARRAGAGRAPLRACMRCHALATGRRIAMLRRKCTNTSTAARKMLHLVSLACFTGTAASGAAAAGKQPNGAPTISKARRRWALRVNCKHARLCVLRPSEMCLILPTYAATSEAGEMVLGVTLQL